MRRTGSVIARCQLARQVLGERDLGADEGLEIVVGVVAAAGADAGPFGIARRLGRRGALRGLARVVGKYVFEIGVHLVLDGAAAGFQLAAEPFVGARAIAFNRRTLAFRFGCGLDSRRLVGRARAFGVLDALEQRIALELGLDIGHQIQVRQLQELDRLHQLRRHHQRLALAKLEFLRKRHYACRPAGGSKPDQARL